MCAEPEDPAGYRTARPLLPIPVTPVALGYARLIEHEDAVEFEQRRHRYQAGLWFWGIARGLDLRLVYIDDFWHAPKVNAFEDLVTHVQRDGIHHVIVPSLQHFTTHHDFQHVTVELFALLEVRLWTVTP